MDEFKERLFINGWELTKAVWTVPQGFGNESFVVIFVSYASPDHQEDIGHAFPPAANSSLRASSGSTTAELVRSDQTLGPPSIDICIAAVVSWDDPTTADIKTSASALAHSLSTMKSFILSPAATIRQVTMASGIDVGLWTVGSETLVLATNMNYVKTSLSLADLRLSGKVTQVLDSGASVDANGRLLNFGEVGSGGFVVRK